MGAEDLAQAAHAAVLGVRALRERMDDAHERCDESSRRIDTLTHAIESDRKALHDAMEELDTSVAEATKKLVDDMAATESGVADVTSASHEAGIEGLQALEVESSALDAFAQHVQDVGPRIAALAEADSRAALQRAAAIADEMNRLVDEAERLLTTDLAAAMAEMMQEVEAAAAEIRDVLDHRCPELLLQGETDFGAKMSEAEDLVKRVFAGMEDHADEVAGHAVEKLGQIVDQEMDAIEAESRTLEGEMENLTGLAAEKTAEIERAGESMTSEMGDNGADAKAAEQALEELRARWITFGFAL